MKIIRLILTGIVLWVALALLAVYYCYRVADKAAKGKLYTDVKDILYRKTALLPGTAKYVAGRWKNLYYTTCIKAAVALYKASKIKYIIPSGDNSSKDYNESETMCDDLIAGGVPSSHIFLDYAGFRTFDSMVRLRKIFSQDSVTVISQLFHNDRARVMATPLAVKNCGSFLKPVVGTHR